MNCEVSTRDIGCMNRIPPIKVILVKILVRNVAIIFFFVLLFSCVVKILFLFLCVCCVNFIYVALYFCLGIWWKLYVSVACVLNLSERIQYQYWPFFFITFPFFSLCGISSIFLYVAHHFILVRLNPSVF